VREFRETDFLENARHFAEQINRSTIRFAQLDTERIENEYGPISESAISAGIVGFVRISDNYFIFRDRIPGQETDF